MKKILALTLAIMMALSIAACGGKTDPTPSGSGTSAPGTQQTDPGTSGDDSDICKTHKDENGDNICDKCGWVLGEVDTSKLKPGANESEWNNADYADYTKGVPEPEFSYSITGVSEVLGMNISFSVDEAQVDTWEQALLDNGFTLTEEDNYGVWTYDSDTHTVEVLETSGAYISIK